MRRNILMLLCLFFLLVLPNAVSANCMNVGYFNSFVVNDSSIILYNGSVPIVKIEVMCSVLPTSTVSLLKQEVCDEDDILVDDSTCMIVSVEPVSPE